MKPITDDMVCTILEGLEKRERKKKAARDAKMAKLHGKVLDRDGGRRIISLDFAGRRARRTVSGMFCYVVRD